jgi:hypothetical protein
LSWPFWPVSALESRLVELLAYAMNSPLELIAGPLASERLALAGLSPAVPLVPLVWVTSRFELCSTS